MSFHKQEDGRWHWKYVGANNKGTIRSLWLCWLAVMIIYCAVMGAIAAAAGISGEAAVTVAQVSAAMVLFLTLIFAAAWLWERFVQKTYAYAVSETQLFVNAGRYRKLPFDNVKLLTSCRERNVIRLKASMLPVEVMVSDEDHEAVWAFLKEHCRNACIK